MLDGPSSNLNTQQNGDFEHWRRYLLCHEHRQSTPYLFDTCAASGSIYSRFPFCNLRSSFILPPQHCFDPAPQTKPTLTDTSYNFQVDFGNMPWLPSFSMVEEEAYQEAIRKTKSMRRASKRAAVPKEQGGGKKTLEAAGKDKAPDGHARKKNAQEKAPRSKRAGQTLARDKPAKEPYEKIRPRDTPQRNTKKRDVRVPQEMHPREMPERQMPVRQQPTRESHERESRGVQRKGHHGFDRPHNGGSSLVPELGSNTNAYADEDGFDDQLRHGARSSRRPSQRESRDLETGGQRDLNRPRVGEPSRNSGPYNNAYDYRDEDDPGYQSQGGERSSQSPSPSYDDEEDLEEHLLRLRRLELLSPPEDPAQYERIPRDTERRETDVFNRRHDGSDSRIPDIFDNGRAPRDMERRDSDGFDCRGDRRALHIPGSFDDENDSEDQEFLDCQSHLGPASSLRLSPFPHSENDPEAHPSRLRRLESLRHSYSPPVAQEQRPADTTRPTRGTYAEEAQERHVRTHELEGRKIVGREMGERGMRSRHVSNHHSGFRPRDHGDDYETDDGLLHRPRGEAGPSHRRSHRDAPYPSHSQPITQIQRPENSRHQARHSQSVKAYPKPHPKPPHQKEPPRPRPHDAPNPPNNQPANQTPRPDNSRRPAAKSQLTEAKPKPRGMRSGTHV